MWAARSTPRRTTAGIEEPASPIGTLEGKLVTCPLHGAKFDVTTGENVEGIHMAMIPELMQKMPQEVSRCSRGWATCSPISTSEP